MRCSWTLVVAVLGCSMALAPPAQGWNNTGHKMAAVLAYRQLDAPTQAAAVRILRAAFAADEGLARFRQDLTANMPSSLSQADQDLFVFATAATWPDIIRDTTHPCSAEFNRPNWHFFDIPFIAAGDTIKVDLNPQPTPEGQEPQDAISAIRFCMKDVKATTTSVRLRAARLAFLLHVVGDLHQPLHCAAQFSQQQLPKGDRGGNLQLVRRPGHISSDDQVLAIHGIFDGLLGHEEQLGRLQEFAAKLERDPKLQPEKLANLLAEKEPRGWAQESFRDAVASAYLFGALKAFRGKSAEQFRDSKLNSALVPEEDPSYASNATPIAERRIVLAGKRLADLLKVALQ